MNIGAIATSESAFHPNYGQLYADKNLRATFDIVYLKLRTRVPTQFEFPSLEELAEGSKVLAEPSTIKNLWGPVRFHEPSELNNESQPGAFFVDGAKELATIDYVFKDGKVTGAKVGSDGDPDLIMDNSNSAKLKGGDSGAPFCKKASNGKFKVFGIVQGGGMHAQADQKIGFYTPIVRSADWLKRADPSLLSRASDPNVFCATTPSRLNLS